MPPKHGINRVTQVLACDGNTVSRAAPIELAAIHKLKIRVEKIDIRCTCRLIRACYTLCFVEQIREAEPLRLRLFLQPGRAVIGIRVRIVAADGHNPNRLSVIVLAECCEPIFDVFDVRAMRTDEHD